MQRVVGDRRVRRCDDRARRRRVDGRAREKASLPGPARIGRDGGADVRRSAVLATPDLKGRDNR